MEFKLDGTTEEALQQIEEKQYALPFDTRLPTAIQDRHNLLCQDAEHREVAAWVRKTQCRLNEVFTFGIAPRYIT